jgi:hypothetical protein
MHAEGKMRAAEATKKKLGIIDLLVEFVNWFFVRSAILMCDDSAPVRMLKYNHHLSFLSTMMIPTTVRKGRVDSSMMETSS